MTEVRSSRQQKKNGGSKRKVPHALIASMLNAVEAKNFWHRVGKLLLSIEYAVASLKKAVVVCLVSRLTSQRDRK